jgi:hypothetical protein
LIQRGRLGRWAASFHDVFKQGLEPGAPKMTKTVEEANMVLVLEAFDTLFNKRDYKAAKRFWSPNYVQHSAHIPPGREGLFNLIQKRTANVAIRTRRDPGSSIL